MAVATSQSPQSPQQQETTGITQREIRNIRYCWIIKNFNRELLHWVDEIKSPEFEDPITRETTWRLEMNKCTVSGIDILSLFIRLISSKKMPLNIIYEIKIVDEKGICVYSGKNTKVKKVLKEDVTFGWDKFIRFDEFSRNSNYLIKNDLQIICNICLFGKITNTCRDMDYDCLKIPKSVMSEDYERLLSNTATSDIVLNIGNKTIQCHKAVLTARSPVFAAMLTHDFKEKKQNKITIEGMEYKVLEDMIWFIYTGRVKDVDQIPLQLLDAANQYALERLKVICEKHLAQRLSVENAVDVLICADRNSSEGLKFLVKRYINYNFKKIIKTESWAFLATSNTSLLDEVLL